MVPVRYCFILSILLSVLRSLVASLRRATRHQRVYYASHVASRLISQTQVWGFGALSLTRGPTLKGCPLAPPRSLHTPGWSPDRPALSRVPLGRVICSSLTCYCDSWAMLPNRAERCFLIDASKLSGWAMLPNRGGRGLHIRQTQMSYLVAINAWILCPDMSYLVAINA